MGRDFKTYGKTSTPRGHRVNPGHAGRLPQNLRFVPRELVETRAQRVFGHDRQGPREVDIGRVMAGLRRQQPPVQTRELGPANGGFTTRA